MIAALRLSAPGCAALGSSTPVPGTTRPAPNRPFMVKLQATAELKRSANTKPAVQELETACSVAPAVAGAWRLRVPPYTSTSTGTLLTHLHGSCAPHRQWIHHKQHIGKT